MTEDTNELNNTRPNEQKRWAAMLDYMTDYEDEIGGLRVEEITPDTATFIAGQVLSLEIQQAYLDAHSNPSSSNRQGMVNSQKEVGKNLKLFRDAQGGDFSGLKQIIKYHEDLRRGMADDEDTSKEEAINDLQIADKLKLIGDVIPEKGDGSLIRNVPPLNTGKPAPLTEQLRALKMGGDSQ